MKYQPISNTSCVPGITLKPSDSSSFILITAHAGIAYEIPGAQRLGISPGACCGF